MEFSPRKILLFSVCILNVFFSAIIGRFIGKTLVAHHYLSLILLLVFLIFLLILLYRRKRRFYLFFLVHFLFLLLCFLCRFFFLWPFFETAVTTGLILYMDNGEGQQPAQVPVGHAHIPVLRNNWLESGMQLRVADLEAANSPFLPQDNRGDFWNNIRLTLEEAPNQMEYNRRLNFESMDITVRESKQLTLVFFRQILNNAENAIPGLNAVNSVKDFYNSYERGNGIWLPTNDEELHFVHQVNNDLVQRGANSEYYQRIINQHGHRDS